MCLILDLVEFDIHDNHHHTIIYNEKKRVRLWNVMCDGFGRREFDSFNHIKHTQREREERKRLI